MLETPCWDEIADFLMYLSDYAFQIGFVAVAVTAEQPDLALGLRYRQYHRAAEAGSDRNCR